MYCIISFGFHILQLHTPNNSYPSLTYMYKPTLRLLHILFFFVQIAILVSYSQLDKEAQCLLLTKLKLANDLLDIRYPYYYPAILPTNVNFIFRVGQ